MDVAPVPTQVCGPPTHPMCVCVCACVCACVRACVGPISFSPRQGWKHSRHMRRVVLLWIPLSPWVGWPRWAPTCSDVPRFVPTGPIQARVATVPASLLCYGGQHRNMCRAVVRRCGVPCRARAQTERKQLWWFRQSRRRRVISTICASVGVRWRQPASTYVGATLVQLLHDFFSS